MLPASTRLMSADDHMIEPAHLWVDRVPARYRDSCPRIVEVEGRQAWLYEDELTYIPMGSCRALPGLRRGGLPARARHRALRRDPARLLRPGRAAQGHGHRRGVGPALLPELRPLRRATASSSDVNDHELGLACLRTYNDFLLDEWCATDPDAPVRRGDPAARRHRRSPWPSSSAWSARAPRRSPSRRTRRCSACRRCTPITGIRCGPSSRRRASRCACTSAARRGS